VFLLPWAEEKPPKAELAAEEQPPKAEHAAEEKPPKAEHAAEEKPPAVDVEEAHAETEDQKPVAGSTCHFAKPSLFLYLLLIKLKEKVQTQDCSACFNLLSDQSETSCCHCDFSNGTWSFRDVLDADSSSSESIPT